MAGRTTTITLTTLLCLGLCRGPWHQVQADVYREPSLSAQPGPLLLPGDNLTLHCHSEPGFDRFALIKDEGFTLPQRLHGQHSPNFPLGPVNLTHGGRYRCYSRHSLSNVWSAPSTPLDILIAVGGKSHRDSLPGLHRGPEDKVQAPVHPKPSIWADPGPIVSKGSPVTIWCQGSLQADGYVLYKERGSEPLDTSIPKASSNKTGFLIQSMGSQHTGLYQCVYSTGDRLSERSEPLLLVLTGEHSAPSLSAHPGPVVTSGGNVSLFCSSQFTWDTSHLLKEGGAEPPRRMKSQWRSHERRRQAVFPVGPLSSSHGGTYRCYGSSSFNPNVWSQPSDPLHLEVTGFYREPSLSAQLGPLLLPGDDLTLQCHSEPGFDRFALTKDEGLTPPQHLHGQHSPNFPLGPVNPTHGGQYRCYTGHNLSYVWSAPSSPLDILIAGKYRKPSLSAQPSPSVPWGVNVTLQCRSEVRADTFHLHMEGSLDPPQKVQLQDTATPSQANFTISPVSWGHQGTYRCYSSLSSSPFQLSQPSDPLELLVSDYTVGNLIRLGVSGLVLLVLTVLLCEAWHSWRRPHDAARS